ncbi:PaaI family thioesterase [Mesorhizobium sp. CN2-181]|uniref:PaaI family thioesterase n=1 Tax=Mesorhizobium yinganensis TaxID=3157707 RepID=UPI0032B84E38
MGTMLRFVLPIIFPIGRPLVFAMIRRRLGEIIPLNKLLEIEFDSISDGASKASLPFRTAITNHIGTVHATAIFGLAEAASGGAAAGALAPYAASIRPVTASASVNFLKAARGQLTAVGQVAMPPDEIREMLSNKRKVQFDVLVDVFDDSNVEIANFIFSWHVLLKGR